MDTTKLKKILDLHAKWLRGENGGVRAELQDVSLRGANLQGASLRGANLQDASLQRADLRGANLQGANLQGANLQDASLQRADLRYANLQDANLQRADLRYANLQDANLRGANLQGANLDYSCWPLHCGSKNVKGDANLVGQLAYHLLDFAVSSGVTISTIEQLVDIANNSSPVTRHRCEKFIYDWED
jgi:uncharacterized protein YjbI with pentapeptide repeats